jgi:type III secretion protein C
VTHLARLRPALWLAAAAACVLTTADAHAASPRLPGKSFVYDARQVALDELLRDFAGAMGLPIVIAQGVTGTVNARFATTPRAFLDLISRSFGLIWYYDGGAVYVYPSAQMQSRLFKLSGPMAEGAEARLLSFGLVDSRYPLRFLPTQGGTLAFASGPPRHIEVVEALIAVLNDNEAPPSPETTRSFVLTHASAVDRVVMGVAVPGLATTLAGFYGQRAGPGGAAGTHPAEEALNAVPGNTAAQMAMVEGSPESRARRDAAMQNIGRTLTSSSPTQAVTPNRPATGGLYTPAPPPPPKRKPGPVSFAADETTNLLLVRAPEDQMPAIEALIAQLDVPRDMIEVEATIIDISSDEVQALGFDWRFNSNSRQVELSPATATTTISGAIPQGGGFNITTLLASGGRDLLARIRALEANGSARVVSQPKVLGAGNRTAVLSDKRTASVRVAGNQDAKLYSVETGTTLQVTPRLIRDPATTRISMELVIEDGGFGSDAVDNVPIAQRTSISTIATLNEGQALLVGGIAVEGSSGGTSGIPFLSKLPVVGGLFRFDASQSSRRQRLFLITPKRVLLDAAAPPGRPAEPVLPAAPAAPASSALDAAGPPGLRQP